MKFEIKLIPPKFNIQMRGFASVLGATFGAVVDVQWQVNKAFKANFTAYPIQLGCNGKDCALKIIASSQARGTFPPCPPARPPAHPPTRLPACLPAHPSARLPTNPPTRPPTHLLLWLKKVPADLAVLSTGHI